MKCLLAAGIRPTVLLTLNRHNLHALDETVHFCRRAGAGGVAVSMLSPMGRGADCYAEFSLDAAEWGEAVRTIRTLQAAYPGFIQAGFCRWSRYPTALEAVRSHGAAAAGAPRTFLPCDAAKTFCAITHDGWVIPCNKFPTYRCGNLRTEKLERIWQSGAMDRIRRLAEQPVAEAGTCAACKYNPVCSGGCRAEAYMAFQSLTAPDPACAVLRDAAVHTIAPQRAPLGARDLARHVPASENTH
jgi:radical SAM protein with 4Fe4S-binding SPASM domain